jgi:hypothetical protein
MTLKGGTEQAQHAAEFCLSGVNFYIIFVLHHDSAVSITSQILSESPAMCEIYILQALNQTDLGIFFDRENQR